MPRAKSCTCRGAEGRESQSGKIAGHRDVFHYDTERACNSEMSLTARRDHDNTQQHTHLVSTPRLGADVKSEKSAGPFTRLRIYNCYSDLTQHS